MHLEALLPASLIHGGAPLKNLEDVVEAWFREVPGQFTNLMRRVLNDPTVTLAWAPRMQRRTYKRHRNDLARRAKDINGVATDYGCFIAIKKVQRSWITMHEGRAILHSTMEPFLFHVFDGEGGEPVVPHGRFLRACIDTDRARHGAQRDRNIDKERVRREREKQLSRDKIAREAAQNNDMYKAFRDFGQEAGLSTPDKDQVLAYERAAAAGEAKIAKRDAEDLKEVQWFHEKSDKDLR